MTKLQIALKHRTAGFVGLLLLVFSAGTGPVTAGNIQDNWAQVTTPYSATYEVHRGKLGLGDIHYRLKDHGENCYRYTGFANPEGLAAMFFPGQVDVSEFCIRDGKLRPSIFKTWRGEPGEEQELDEEMAEGIDEVDEDNYILKFNWPEMQVTSSELLTWDLQDNSVDLQSMHMAMRYWLVSHEGSLPEDPIDFAVAVDNKTKVYSFTAVGYEEVSTRAGRYRTIRVDQVNRPKRSVRFWLAPELDYIPVKLQRLKNGDPSVTTVLRAIRIRE